MASGKKGDGRKAGIGGGRPSSSLSRRWNLRFESEEQRPPARSLRRKISRTKSPSTLGAQESKEKLLGVPVPGEIYGTILIHFRGASLFRSAALCSLERQQRSKETTKRRPRDGNAVSRVRSTGAHRERSRALRLHLQKGPRSCCSFARSLAA